MAPQRLRITFTKASQLKYISHLDLALTWARALRRAEIPLAYSQGHNPQARLQLASGLPLGYTGSAEVVDIFLTESLAPDELAARLEPTLPQGLGVVAVEEVNLKSPSLQAALRQAVYRVSVETWLPSEELARRIEDILAASHLEGERKRKGRIERFDLRPLVDDVWLESVTQGQAVMGMRLSTGQQGHVRPDAVLAALGLGETYAQFERRQLLFEFE